MCQLATNRYVKEYDGFIMGAKKDQYRTGGICVSRLAEPMDPSRYVNAAADYGSKTYVYPTEIEVSKAAGSAFGESIYANMTHSEVTCAVCTADIDHGVTITIPGASSCPAETVGVDVTNVSTIALASSVFPVMSSLLAGSYFSHRGSLTNAYCLAQNATFRHTSKSRQGGAELHESEFQTGVAGDGVTNREVPCADCRVQVGVWCEL